jgi:hypothetical protein
MTAAAVERPSTKEPRQVLEHLRGMKNTSRKGILMNNRTCTAPDCGRPHYGLDLCQKHYARMRTNGTLELQGRARRDPAERFWLHVDKTEFCWLWTGNVNRKGYGRFNDGDVTAKAAHRWSYEHVNGPIPVGLQIDHLCRTPACVNPSHLEAVTPRENTVRGMSPELTSARHAAITHCPANHEYTVANTYRGPSGKRQCRACNRERARQRKVVVHRD